MPRLQWFEVTAWQLLFEEHFHSAALISCAAHKAGAPAGQTARCQPSAGCSQRCRAMRAALTEPCCSSEPHGPWVSSARKGKSVLSPLEPRLEQGDTGTQHTGWKLSDDQCFPSVSTEDPQHHSDHGPETDNLVWRQLAGALNLDLDPNGHISPLSETTTNNSGLFFLQEKKRRVLPTRSKPARRPPC